MGLTIAQLDWGNRTPNMFIDTAVKETQILGMFTLIDGVKSKVQVPIFSGELVFGTDICVFDPQSTANIDEKEMTVTTKKWAFQNCKNKLQDTYRSVMLKKGANNPETLDSEFKDWLFGYFAKLAAAKVLQDAATDIRTEILADANVIKPAKDALTAADEADILTVMANAYKSLSTSQLERLYGVADREFKPVFLLPIASYKAYQLAIAAKTTTVYDGLRDGKILPFLGMEVIPFSTLAAEEMILTNPANLVMIVDDYADVRAIDSDYKKEISSDLLWGQMTYGFSYFRSEDIVYYTTTA